MAWRYLVALGSNRRVNRFGAPPRVLRAAAVAMADAGLDVLALSPVIASAPLGPSRRRYANAVAEIETALDPPALLRVLNRIEDDFGRLRRGRPWSERSLDCDIVAWSGGSWGASDLVIPHPEFRKREFVLAPAATIAPRWRDPHTGLSMTHLASRLTRPRPRP
ncbi:2-amino-4-hydroxy-6-hydroxymethyldihydropteridine diphosphokinase [Novosphingobium tardum]|uniref:2-amino-4-hydroxy-6-hydroxymethyldihydropteridine pyrophosphokinase n=1 Tax=Novosphingobium tardum TaxID=1538021 RepID=A0ABV8RKF7_9SPHN